MSTSLRQVGRFSIIWQSDACFALHAGSVRSFACAFQRLPLPGSAGFSRHHTKLPCLLAISILILLGCATPPAYADGFPGKGDPDAWSDALPYFNRGNRYLQKEQYQQAVDDFTEAIGHYQYDPDFYTNLGIGYRKLGQYAQAEEAYKKALKLNDKDWMPWSDLANLYLKQNKLKEAIATFQRTLTCNPPANEKAAIQKDILDINKILKMQQPLPVIPSKSKTTKAPRVQASTKAVAGAAESPTASPNAKDLKGSGWDYVYDKK